MNNIFNIKRFGLLLRRDFLENGKRYLLQFLTMFGVIVVVLLWNSYQYYDSQLYPQDAFLVNLLNIIAVLFLIFGVLSASMLMEPMRNKIKRIAYLTNPASNFEKIFSRWLIVTIGYIFAFFLALWLADVIRVAFCSISFPEIEISFLDLSKMYPEGECARSGFVFSSEQAFFLWLGFYFLMQSLFVQGATFWPKGTFIKTFSAIVIVIGLFLLLCYWAILIGYETPNEFTSVLDSFEVSRNMQEEQLWFIGAGIFILFAVVNWVIAFFRFRESEITKRL